MKFRALKTPLDQICKMKFVKEMNILNLAIDQEKVQIVKYLAAALPKDEKLALVHHKSTEGINAVHQVVALGNAELTRLVINEFGGDLCSLSEKQIGVLHYAA